jgi:protein O-mannosyl-transferase
LTLRSCAVQKANFITAINLPDALAAPYLVVQYLLNLIAPFQLKILYDVHPSIVSSALCSVAIAILIAAAYFWKKHDEMLLGVCWFLLFLLPVINIIPLDQSALMADRYAYFSLMGFALCLAAASCRLNGRIATVGIVALCAVYTFIDIQRNGIWENETRFFTRMTLDAPEKFDGFQNLGMLVNGN